MIAKLLLVLVLTGMWVTLWGDLDIGTVLGGVLTAFAIAFGVPSPENDRRWVIRPIGVIRFQATFLVLLVASTWSMVRLVLSKDAGTVQGKLIEVELAPESYPVRTLIAHSISLTPGTLTVDVREDGRTLQIHVIDESDIDDARRAVAALEHRAREAFAPVRTVGSTPTDPVKEAP